MNIDLENEKRLTSILDRTINFVKYAEAKNGAVVAVSAALMAAILKTNISSNCIARFCIVGALVSLALAAIIAFGAFLPILEPKRGIASNRSATERNPLFFGHTADLSPEAFLNELYRDVSNNYNYAELFYAEQIVTNSDIANKKFAAFKSACYAMLFGILFLTIAALVSLF